MRYYIYRKLHYGSYGFKNMNWLSSMKISTIDRSSCLREWSDCLDEATTLSLDEVNSHIEDIKKGNCTYDIYIYSEDEVIVKEIIE